MKIKSRDKKRFLQRRSDISAKKCTEKLQEFEYFDRSNLPCAADDAAIVISEPKLKNLNSKKRKNNFSVVC